MARKQRTLLLAVLTLVLCLALVAGGTYALFTADATFTNHLQAGELKVKLERIGLTSFELDPTTGYMLNVSNTQSVDFTNATAANVFGVSGSSLIVPCSEYTATMQITNSGDVAFGYWLEIKFKDADGNNITSAQLAALHLDDQIEVKLDGRSIVLSEGLVIRGENGGYVGKIAKPSTTENPHNLPSSATFTISVKFLDDTDINNGLTVGQNNDAMSEHLYFDLIFSFNRY